MQDSDSDNNLAPGAPGADARWSPGPKAGVGTALNCDSNVWFTIGHGILNEIYYPHVDTPSIRDMGLIITDGNDYFSEEKATTDSRVEWMEPGVPAFRVSNISRDGYYKIEKQVISDPKRNTVLQHTVFSALKSQPNDYRVYVLLAPHLGDMGGGNTAWIADFQGTPMLLAERDGCVLALACSTPFIKRSVGFVGVSDGWQDLQAHKQMTWQYQKAENGNTALTAEIDLSGPSNEFVLSLGFGTTADEATANALASLAENFDDVKKSYIDEWQAWHKTISQHSKAQLAKRDLTKISLSVLRSHQSKGATIGIVAGLASPWGYVQGDSGKIGYHAVWTRDMVESTGGLLAAGDHQQVREMLNFLEVTQRPDGHWPQNMWVDGTAYWDGIQMDETALPIMLVNLAYREQAITDDDITHFWPMIERAASYLLKNGPVTQQDRWEEDPGYTPFTVAAEIAALLAAADFADMQDQPFRANYLREVADVWHDSIDDWMYAAGTEWCKQFGVDGYYERIAPINTEQVTRTQNCVHVQNVPEASADMRAAHLISLDALALVRFGLRAADDPRIVSTVKIIDALLKIDTPSGTTWHRYNNDGYGEQADGSAFDGTGIGRGWPLLTGERAHYELSLGRKDEANRLQTSMEQFAGDSGLLPEQVWDSADIPEHELSLGRPSGSAMPLAWAHAEYLKLRRSLRDGRIFDLPPQTVQRYLVDETVSPRKAWRFNHKIRHIPVGKSLRIEVLASATVHWTNDNWQTVHDTKTIDTTLGMHILDIPSNELKADGQLKFTFYWHHADSWEGQDFIIAII
ncbi:MAG: glucan 1,4-alpha-glucosidase [Candidatus Saccharimonadales bacterium]